jgi:hypothetical protein
MTDALQPATVDANGNITAHGRGGLSLVLTFQNADGTARDVSALTMYFEVAGSVRVALGAGATTDKRTLTLTRTQVGAMGAGRKDFAVIDETATPDVIWAGSISVKGYTDAPA